MPECHHGSMQDGTDDNLFNKETHGKNYLKELRSVEVLLGDKQNT